MTKTNARAPRLRPPIRWSGGKYRLVAQLMAVMPDSYGRYFEPMAGSAALFFAVCPQEALLCDINKELINYYRVLRDQTEQLIDSLTSMLASKELYYSLRSATPGSDLDRAVRFAYLNRLCWNG